MVFLEPLGVQRHYVPHFKDLISGKVELEAKGRDSTFTFCHALLKKTILHYKIEFGQRLLHMTVTCYSCNFTKIIDLSYLAKC